MYEYRCHFCGGMCDAGELENGVCFECREESQRRREMQNMKVRKDINQKMRVLYAQHADGQMVMRYGSG